MDEVRKDRELHTEDLAGAVPPADRGIPARGGREYEEPAGPRGEGEHPPLFPSEETQSYRTEWTTIQTGFVDEPRRAVEQADALVARVVKRLAESFAEERSGLERQWDRGAEINTEDLRIALTRYRSFFDRLLTL